MTNSSRGFATIAVLVVVIALFAGMVGYAVWKYQSPTAVLASWKTYHRANHGYEIQYPPDLVILEDLEDGKGGFGFGTSFGRNIKSPNYLGDFFVVGISKEYSSSVGQRMTAIQHDYKDAVIAKENITLNGMPAVKITATRPSNTGWYLETIYLATDDRVYWMSNNNVKNPLFETFYNSFHILPDPRSLR